MQFTKRFTARAPIPIAVAFAMMLTACSSTSHPSSSSATTAGPTLAAATKIITAWPADITSLDPANLSTNEDHD